MHSFREYYRVGDLNFDDLEFENACNSDAVRAVLGALGQDWASNTLTTAPMGAILRVAEGIDSLRNLDRSGMANATGTERASAIVCGLSQLGGLLFSAVAIVASLALCVFAPVGSALALCIYKRFRQRARTPSAQRNVELDKLIDDKIQKRMLNMQPKARGAEGEEKAPLL